MTRFKIRRALAGRLSFTFTTAGALTRVRARYDGNGDADDPAIDLNTGSNNISFSKYDLDPEEKTLHINSFHIDRVHQKRGYGTMILAALHQKWFEMGFKKVIINNASNMGRIFYTNLGYKKDFNRDYVFKL